MKRDRLRVGLIGLQEGRSWGARAHVPALRALADEFDIVGVANTTRTSAERAAEALGIRRAFPDVAALVTSPDVDIVSVTVKVPHHFEIVSAAIAAGKHVYCEWPLGNGLAEAEAMAGLARGAGILGVVGTQARYAPEIVALRTLVGQGFVGDVLSSTLVGSGMRWGAEVDEANAYLLDNRNGASMLTIPLGHMLAAVREVLGDVAEVSARLLNRRRTATLIETREQLPMTAHDQVLAHAVMNDGAPLSIHYRGGRSRGTGLLWEINGTEGDLQLTGSVGHPQMVRLSLFGGRDKSLSEIPPAEAAGFPPDPIPGNVARVYSQLAADLRNGTTLAPSFDDAVTLHRTLAAMERSSSEQGRSVTVRDVILERE